MEFLKAHGMRKMIIAKTFMTIIAFGCLWVVYLIVSLNLTSSTKSKSDDNSNDQKDEYISEWSCDDERLIKHIMDFYLIPPSPLQYNLQEPDREDWSQKGESKFAAELLNHRKNGFFVEAGALDGETFSNTLMFEIYYNFSGLLVEPDPSNFANLVRKNRKAWLLNGCLTGSKFPQKLQFISGQEFGALVDNMSLSRRFFASIIFPSSQLSVWCFPLQAVMAAIKVHRIDYFSLDVEGGEADILSGLDEGEMVSIQLLEVEYMVFEGAFWNHYSSRKKKLQIDQIINSKLPNFKEVGRRFLDVFYMKDFL